MCGIFGVAARRLPESFSIKVCLNAIRHRGPDDEGYLLADIVRDKDLSFSGNDHGQYGAKHRTRSEYRYFERYVADIE